MSYFDIKLIKRWLRFPKSANELMQCYVETGNSAMLERLYNMHADKLYHYLLVLTSTEMAADVSQQTWIKLIEKRHLFRDNYQFEAWLFTIARNTLVDNARKNSKLLFNSELIESRHTFSEKNDGDTKHEQSKWLQQQLKTLSFEQREALCLQLEGFSLEDISKICQCPKETIKTRLRYARDRLKHAKSEDNEK